MNEEIENIKKELDALKKEVETVKNTVNKSRTNEKELNKKIDSIKDEIKELNNQLITYMAKNDTATIVKDITDELLKNTLDSNNKNDDQINNQMDFMNKMQKIIIYSTIAIVLGACSLIFPQIPNLIKALF